MNNRTTFKRAALLAAIAAGLGLISQQALSADMSRGADNFYVSPSVTTQRVRFTNTYGMEVVGTLFTPKGIQPGKKHASLVVGHPFAAVRQQSANLYATKMAEAGFVSLTFDQSYWGESAGTPRGAVLPDVYAENFSAAVDFLGTHDFVAKDRIGVIGICGSGGFSIEAAKIDPRIKALATVSMYDMGEYFRTGLQNNRSTENQRKDLALAAAARAQQVEAGQPVYGPGQNDAVFLEAAESNDFYRTERGHVPTNDRRSTPATYVKLMNFHPFIDIETISPRPLLFIVGEIAPSRSFTETAYRMAAQPKELVVVPAANRIDLYDRTEVIPWAKLTSFFQQHLPAGS